MTRWCFLENLFRYQLANLVLDTAKYFFAMYGDFLGRFETKAYRSSMNAHDRQFNIISNHNSFTSFST